MGPSRWNTAHHMMDTLMQDFISLLDGGCEEADAQLAMVQAAPMSSKTLNLLGVPEWATQGVVNFRGKVSTMGDQYVALI